MLHLLIKLAGLVWFLPQLKKNEKMSIEIDSGDRLQQQPGSNDEKLSNTVKNPDDWKTGDEPMTGAQRSYLNTLADEAGEEINADLTKAEASKKIDELRQKSDRLNDERDSESQSERRDENEEQGLRGGASSV